ncbi:PREDICTED: F-box protein CPR30-like [Nicotiana attenuata]|uniref:F-box protein cpr30 n=1 Tax=Nicotiana attenuata TaxID=49451 RepID=A0A314KUI6_NICAT|nr:PREDICTED: F-box protein CPR30-like [Nicotiana attenuata]OIT32875.1 f-box protein cpr30 [Nicotiana attenuata]
MCVSRGFKSRIGSSEFAKVQLKESLKCNFSLKDSLINSSNLFVLVGKHCDSGTSFYTLSIASLCSGSIAPRELKNPVKSADCVTTILGSCHGLLLMTNNTSSNTISYDMPLNNPNRDLSLWNPSTGYHREIPLHESKNGNRFCMGIGYDLLLNDYKVVRIGPYPRPVEMFSLKQNTWRAIGQLMFQPVGRGTYLNGKLHWTAKHTFESCKNYESSLKNPNERITMRARHEPRVIVAIDLGMDTLNVQLIQAPPSIEKSSKMFLTVLGGTLCAILFHPFKKVRETWVMKEYGVEDSWKMIMAVEAAEEASRGDSYGYRMPLPVPLAYSENKDDILFDHHGQMFIWASKIEGELRFDKRILNTQVFPSTGCEVYMGSLVPYTSEEDKENHHSDEPKEEGEDKDCSLREGKESYYRSD